MFITRNYSVLSVTDIGDYSRYTHTKTLKHKIYSKLSIQISGNIVKHLCISSDLDILAMNSAQSSRMTKLMEARPQRLGLPYIIL